ncbi:hypothetical protein SNEBB_010232 [Seison nebaliae]|nr:hypothetical protein SNEBB_010232 [Seison nebaliae]
MMSGEVGKRSRHYAITVKPIHQRRVRHDENKPKAPVNKPLHSATRVDGRFKDYANEETSWYMKSDVENIIKQSVKQYSHKTFQAIPLNMNVERRTRCDNDQNFRLGPFRFGTKEPSKLSKLSGPIHQKQRRQQHQQQHHHHQQQRLTSLRHQSKFTTAVNVSLMANEIKRTRREKTKNNHPEQHLHHLHRLREKNGETGEYTVNNYPILNEISDRKDNRSRRSSLKNEIKLGISSNSPVSERYVLEEGKTEEIVRCKKNTRNKFQQSSSQYDNDDNEEKQLMNDSTITNEQDQNKSNEIDETDNWEREIDKIHISTIQNQGHEMDEEENGEGGWKRKGLNKTANNQSSSFGSGGNGRRKKEEKEKINQSSDFDIFLLQLLAKRISLRKKQQTTSTATTTPANSEDSLLQQLYVEQKESTMLNKAANRSKSTKKQEKKKELNSMSISDRLGRKKRHQIRTSSTAVAPNNYLTSQTSVSMTTSAEEIEPSNTIKLLSPQHPIHPIQQQQKCLVYTSLGEKSKTNPTNQSPTNLEEIVEQHNSNDEKNAVELRLNQFDIYPRAYREAFLFQSDEMYKREKLNHHFQKVKAKHLEKKTAIDSIPNRPSLKFRKFFSTPLRPTIHHPNSTVTTLLNVSKVETDTEIHSNCQLSESIKHHLPMMSDGQGKISSSDKRENMIISHSKLLQFEPTNIHPSSRKDIEEAEKEDDEKFVHAITSFPLSKLLKRRLNNHMTNNKNAVRSDDGQYILSYR